VSSVQTLVVVHSNIVLCITQQTQFLTVTLVTLYWIG